MMKRAKQPRRVAHFLLIPELLYSPPNNAIVTAWISLGFEVHIFSPGQLPETTTYGEKVITHKAEYTMRWLIKNIARIFWLRFSCFSGTSEDPLAVVGALAAVYRRPSFLLVDEIKAGSYRGNSSERWKQLCKWSIQRADFNIVSDSSRIELLLEYAKLPKNAKVIVYPGCYHSPPKPNAEFRKTLREKWKLPQDALVIASSGGFNLTAGADWLIDSLQEDKELHAVIQPLGITHLSHFLLSRLDFENRLYLQEERMTWEDAWQSAVGFDIGMAIYTNQAPQFQKMGISSNRLCMFIAMGVPVICSRQKSFEFVEEYNCGVMVDSYSEFLGAIQHIRMNLKSMQSNCFKALQGYVMPPERYPSLKSNMASIT